jgi:bestrophin, other
MFGNVVHYCDTYSELIPLSFVLGFYVSVVMTRWWSQYQTIPWPDPIAVFVSATIHGQVILILRVTHLNALDFLACIF